MFFYYWKLALIMLLIIPLYSIIYTITNRLNKKTERRIMERAAELESQLVESLNAVGTIKRFGMEYFANIKTETRFINLLKIGYKSALNSVFTSTSSGIISQLFTIIYCGWILFCYRQGYCRRIDVFVIIGYFKNHISSWC